MNEKHAQKVTLIKAGMVIGSFAGAITNAASMFCKDIWSLSEEGGSTMLTTVSEFYQHWFPALFIICLVIWVGTYLFSKDDKISGIFKKVTIGLFAVYVITLAPGFISATGEWFANNILGGGGGGSAQ